MAKPILTVVPHDPPVALRLAIKKVGDVAKNVRLKAILKATEGKKRAVIAKELMVSERSVATWIGAYNQGGTEALTSKKSGRKVGPQKWDTPIFDSLAKEIDKGGYWSIPRMQEWIKEHHHQDIPEQTVWYRMDKLKYSYKGA